MMNYYSTGFLQDKLSLIPTRAINGELTTNCFLSSFGFLPIVSSCSFPCDLWVSG